MSDSPVLLCFMIGLGLYLGKLWWDDCRDHIAGRPGRAPMPGAVPASTRSCVIAVIGALIIVAAETIGEIALGLSEEQSEITILFGLYTLVAAVIEEVIFRGYLVIEGRGRGAQWAGAIGASLLFAALHPFLWEWEDAGFAFTFTMKGWFSTTAVFASSLWFYAARLARWNPSQSLLPCIAAHAAKNAAVFAIKGAQGFVGGWW